MKDLLRDVDESATFGIQQSQYLTRQRSRSVDCAILVALTPLAERAEVLERETEGIDRIVAPGAARVVAVELHLVAQAEWPPARPGGHQSREPYRVGLAQSDTMPSPSRRQDAPLQRLEHEDDRF